MFSHGKELEESLIDMINRNFEENEVTYLMNSGFYKNQIKSFPSFNLFILWLQRVLRMFQIDFDRLILAERVGRVAAWYAVRTCYLRLTDRQAVNPLSPPLLST